MNIELHENLMRVTVDTFKRETDKLKEKALYWESQYRASEETVASMRNFEGVDLIAAAMAFFEAQRNMYDAARKYEERNK